MCHLTRSTASHRPRAFPFIFTLHFRAFTHFPIVNSTAFDAVCRWRRPCTDVDTFMAEIKFYGHVRHRRNVDFSNTHT